MKKTIVLFVLLAILFAGCANPYIIDDRDPVRPEEKLTYVDLDKDFNLRLTQTAALKGADFKVKFSSYYSSDKEQGEFLINGKSYLLKKNESAIVLGYTVTVNDMYSIGSGKDEYSAIANLRVSKNFYAVDPIEPAPSEIPLPPEGGSANGQSGFPI